VRRRKVQQYRSYKNHQSGRGRRRRRDFLHVADTGKKVALVDLRSSLTKERDDM